MRAPLAAAIAASMALAAALLAFRGVPEGRATTPVVHEARDPDLARCRELGEAAARDATCVSAWRQSRDRFFGGRGR